MHIIMKMHAIDPNWVSYSLAIFICERCAGIHQSLDSHVSKVKSIEDENWTDEQLQVSFDFPFNVSENFFPIKICELVKLSAFSQSINHLANVNSGSRSLGPICRRPSVCLSSVCNTFVHPTQPIEIFGNISTLFGTLANCDLSVKILRRSYQETLHRGV